MSDTRVVTGKVRFAYPSVVQPRELENGQTKYTLQVIVPKSDKRTVAALQDAMKFAAVQRWGEKGLRGVEYNFRDGDEEDKGPDYEGCYFFNSSNKFAPDVVDNKRQPILSADKIKSGDYGRVAVNAWTYEMSGKRAVSLGLENVQWLESGDHIGGKRRSAEDDFADAWGKSDDDVDEWEK